MEDNKENQTKKYRQTINQTTSLHYLFGLENSSTTIFPFFLRTLKISEIPLFKFSKFLTPKLTITTSKY